MELPPPACVTRDEPAAADAARRRLAQKSRFPRLLSRKDLKGSKSSPDLTTAQLIASTSAQPLEYRAHASLITLDSTNLEACDEYTDKYEWAIVYENQRGLTMFSVPYYSRLSLLPNDPPPFTIPGVSGKLEQCSTTLADYPLPDGTWRWVSKCWMIDMRSDSGEVQHDGFEYNWMFRAHKWSAEVGALSAGGPGNHGEGPPGQSTPSVSTGTGLSTDWRRRSIGASLPPSISTLDFDLLSADEPWIRGDVAGNWSKCRALSKKLGRDGRKLELWKAWLLHCHPNHPHAFEGMNGNGKARRPWTEDEGPLPSELADVDLSTRFVEQLQVPSKEDLIPVLRAHGNDVLKSFIYPDSRAKFLAILRTAGLLPELNVSLGMGSGGSEMNFWSYTNQLADKFPVLSTSHEDLKD
ncbi:hypothetical protein DXG03_007029 [Asterophora parasitica]|uniref:Uncharacterized protein n=1 Tax=Asterophora parasitica TaxID=117018 RepID=A0A9P7GIM7_9AGAR|nr:hypothetical protein DXG03_007029 [Asterophora parasitica]